MVTAFKESGLSVKAAEYIKKTAEPLPQFVCSTCKKLQGNNFCSCFSRPVNTKYNKCWNHSNYNNISKFKAPDNIDEIAYLNSLQFLGV